jgi:hypothetical protein
LLLKETLTRKLEKVPNLRSFSERGENEKNSFLVPFTTGFLISLYGFKLKILAYGFTLAIKKN